MKRIGDLITGREVITLTEAATVQEAVLAMRDQHVGALLVLGEDGSPVGIFTERDVMLRVVVPRLDPETEVIATHMTRDLFSVSPERTLSDAAQEMQKRHIRHLPVIRGTTVLGLLSLRDLLRELLKIKLEEVQALTAYIQGEGESASD